MNYQSAGVDIDAAEEAVKRIRTSAESTYNDRNLSVLGGFGGLFSAQGLGADPVLVSTTDGVGTKAELARLGHNYAGLGADLVAMCIDDLVCTGAKPLFFLDYLAVGKTNPEVIEQVVSGISVALRSVNASLVGGEIAEHPGIMKPDAIDLAGFAVGVVERNEILGPDRVEEGDLLLGLPSPNLRANGFSLVRAIYRERLETIFAHDSAPSSRDEQWYRNLLEPSILYAPSILKLLDTQTVHAIAHITGGGLRSNLGRVIPNTLAPSITEASWPVPPIFEQIARDGGVLAQEMERTFNMGVGMVLVIERDALSTVQSYFESSFVIGKVVSS